MIYRRQPITKPERTFLMSDIAICHPAPTPRRSLITRLRHLYGIWRQRRALARLSNAQLQDIGVTRAQADAEAARPFWDAPPHWR
jgi:uncharacterized protein YjiS (DUF1127 family)